MGVRRFIEPDKGYKYENLAARATRFKPGIHCKHCFTRCFVNHKVKMKVWMGLEVY